MRFSSKTRTHALVEEFLFASRTTKQLLPDSFISVLRFVDDKQQMNVALTRARHALYVFGHMETLKVPVFWCLVFVVFCTS